MDIKANHLRLTGACLLDSNVNKLHKTYALGMMHKQQFIQHLSGMLPNYIWVQNGFRKRLSFTKCFVSIFFSFFQKMQLGCEQTTKYL